MLKIAKGEKFKYPIKPFGYSEKKNILSYLILPTTRWLRAKYAEKYMRMAQRHLDIGCGDGFLLKRSKCEERFGIDRLLGDEIGDKFDFPDSYFDYVTMLAVIEHFPNPGAIFKDIARILKPSGKLILTTPRSSAPRIIRLYIKDVDIKHCSCFDFDSIKALSGDFFEIIDYRTFLFGLNQVFCLQKK